MKTFFSQFSQIIIIAAIAAPLYSQPDLTLWRLEESIQQHGEEHHDDDLTEFYDCGSLYYAVVRDPEVDHLTTWSIRNDGDAELVFDLPLIFEGASQRFTIVEQPSVSTLQPGEEVLFTVRYEQIDIDDYAYLILYSNDPEEQNCAYAFDAGAAVSLCACDGNNEVLDIFTKPIGGTGGIIIGSGSDCPPEGTFCQPMSIIDPTDCSQLVTSPGGLTLFADTLTIDALSGALFFRLLANNNPDGFLDENGVPYVASMSAITIFTDAGAPIVIGPNQVDVPILTEPSPGIYKIPFFRAPGSIVDISIEGTPFVSANPAPTVESCAPEIVPTMSEWSVIILALFLLILSVVMMRNEISNGAVNRKRA